MKRIDMLRHNAVAADVQMDVKRVGRYMFVQFRKDTAVLARDMTITEAEGFISGYLARNAVLARITVTQ